MDGGALKAVRRLLAVAQRGNSRVSVWLNLGLDFGPLGLLGIGLFDLHGFF
ncbi:hypothetical protein ES319_A08G146500v1 [Gossypium barbadense]|uniref:Uncharacterized protein n=1 Tax=Gossypium barbadense TaxID=3634 RepID=A0A5J5US15_GOSBA|nr:hypothetical protein ES319_A08G146500v1 [Gossypium barbadense]